MRAIQTLWCGDRSLKNSQFWWSHAEYNLFSWALSCLSLREAFGEVTLYTDSEGARMLVDTLKLPYTEVKVVYDGFDCLTCHWALAKVKTYALQNEPFLHIDGDIYVPKPLGADILASPLITQNEEIATEYYRNMIERFLSIEGLKLEPRMLAALRAESVPSYNLGFCGGNDLVFFKDFYEAVERFFRDNDFNGPRFRDADISANVIFEQMFFSILAKAGGVRIASVYPGVMRDNGYTVGEFCNLRQYESRQFIHILGGHKRNADNCHMLELTLLRKYPEYYERIIALYPERHRRLFGIPVALEQPQAAPLYNGFIEERNAEWSKISREELLKNTKSAANGIRLMAETDKISHDILVEKNPHVSMVNISLHEKDAVCERLKLKSAPESLSVAVLPTISQECIEEVPMSALLLNILALLECAMPLSQLAEKLSPCFGAQITTEDAEACILRSVKSAAERELVFVRREERDKSGRG